jgi:hypothetical protein
MPAYGDPAFKPKNFTPGTKVEVWKLEKPGKGAPVANAACVPMALPRGLLPVCFAVEIEFSAAPGAFSLDVELADTNAEKYYVKRAPAITAVSATGFVARVEVTNVVAKYVRLKMGTVTANDVTITARIS